MADATNRPPVKTPQPQRDDLQRLIPDNVRLRRALEQLFIDVNQTLPDAVQQVGDNSQAVTEDVSMGVFGATDRRTARTLADLAEALDRSDASMVRKLAARVADLESQLDNRQPVKARLPKFIAPTLLNSWVNFGGGFNDAGYLKDFSGTVHLRGLVKNGVIGNAIFQLPAGYRPANEELQITISNGALGRVDIYPSGDVGATSGSNAWFSLDGITFRAA